MTPTLARCPKCGLVAKVRGVPVWCCGAKLPAADACPFCSKPLGGTYPQRCECGARFDYHGDPGTPQKARGLGDVLSKVLGAVGITKTAGCGCSERQIALNAVFSTAPKNPEEPKA